MTINLNFTAALEVLGQDAAFEFANAVRPDSFYLWNSILPERNEPGYSVSDGFMTVRSAMAGLAGLDSPYPPTGITEVSTFIQEVAKLANYVILPEAAIRRMQDFMLRGQGMPVDVNWVAQEALNFLDKVIVQPHMDAMEYLRSQALLNGTIDWNFNQMNLAVSYGIPAGNILTTRTGTDAWTGSTSEFWTDIRLLQQVLRYNVRAFVVHPDTALAILDNSVNNILVNSVVNNEFTQTYDITRIVGTTERPDSDARYSIQLVTYGEEGEILDLANPGQTTIVNFMQTGKILAIGNNTRGGYRVGEGSTPDPLAERALGYTHIAPTVEGGGRSGRWAQLYVPENTPMQLHGRGVTNGLPVIQNPEKVAIASSDIA